MEADARPFYATAASHTIDAGIRILLGDLAAAEMAHVETATEIADKHLPGEKLTAEDEDARKRFMLQIVQPGLAGLTDGSVSTLAPVFAAAFATQKKATTRSYSAWPRRSAPASAWAWPRRWPITISCRAGARR